MRSCHFDFLPLPAMHMHHSQLKAPLGFYSRLKYRQEAEKLNQNRVVQVENDSVQSPKDRPTKIKVLVQ